MKEIWKDIEGYKGIYQISNLGRVKSLERIDNTDHVRHEIILKQSLDKDGYCIVGLSNKGFVKHYRVHRLVWKSFNGEIPEGMQVNHLNERKDDNRLENLNLMDCKSNINWGTGIERRSLKRKGDYNGKLSKPVLQFDLEGNFIKEWPSIIEIKRQLGYSNGNVSLCCRGIYKSYKGYIWKYK